MNKIDDSQIVRLFHEKNPEQAFRLLVDAYKEPLYWHIRRIVIGHDDTHDVLQNVFLKAWQGLKNYRYEAGLYTWLYRIATNESLNFLNEKSRRTFGYQEDITQMLTEKLVADPYFDGNRIQMELQQAILQLSERQRLVFNMKYYEEMKYEDMATILDCAVGTLKATYHTAVKKIEQYLKLVEN
ncbi:MAG: RNA polymerase sigma factor [Marinifilaceae bacterium]